MRRFQIKTITHEDKLACLEKARSIGLHVGRYSWANRHSAESFYDWPFLKFEGGIFGGCGYLNTHYPCISPEDFLALGESK